MLRFLLCWFFLIFIFLFPILSSVLSSSVQVQEKEQEEPHQSLTLPLSVNQLTLAHVVGGHYPLILTNIIVWIGKSSDKEVSVVRHTKFGSAVIFKQSLADMVTKTSIIFKLKKPIKVSPDDAFSLQFEEFKEKNIATSLVFFSHF